MTICHLKVDNFFIIFGMKNFFRKVAFGLKPDEKTPSDPLVWAQKQVETIPEFNWKGKYILSEKEMRKYWITMRVEENTTLRKKYKNDPEGFRKAERQLENDVGKKFWPNNEICIRHAEALRSDHPVLAKLWYFWGNHFTISDTQTLSSFSTGAYQREFLRSNMDKTFETMVKEATLAWPMIMHLDNKDNVGPKSISGKEDWRRQKKEPATINENHARELMELHTISPDGGYTQEDVIELAKIMTGWRPKWTKGREHGHDVSFDREIHEPGKKKVLGKVYKSGKKGIKLAIKDLVSGKEVSEWLLGREKSFPFPLEKTLLVAHHVVAEASCLLIQNGRELPLYWFDTMLEEQKFYNGLRNSGYSLLASCNRYNIKTGSQENKEHYRDLIINKSNVQATGYYLLLNLKLLHFLIHLMN